MSDLEQRLRARRDAGRKLLVPFVSGGLGPDWLDVVRTVAAAGADAVEVGLPFSDPVMDGAVIQEASARALAAGATPAGLVAELAKADAGVPLVVMTSYNLVFRAGHRRFARSLAQAGVSGAILPDLPLEELGDWARAADDAGVDTILLVAPTTPERRLAAICDRSRGWVYAVGHLGVTGERTTLASSAALMGKRVKAVTDKPVLVG
ncbi:MAG TPA: tryptophan synthase subunit alpha, partial [Acidimicrobiales bacterium]|nr:tryptophan synthase subunit alpha [Acidimicrobiales bacterium]